MSNKNKGGRPSVYSTRIEPYLKQIAAMREAGIPHDDIIPLLNISKRTYYNHKGQIEEFLHLTKIGDEELVKSGKMSLRKLVDGFERKTTTRKYKYYYPTLDISKNESIYFDEELALEGIKYLDEEVVRIEEVAPEPSSVYFTLVNKTKGEYRHKQEIEYKHDIEGMKEVKSFGDMFMQMMEKRKNEKTTDQ